MAPSDNDPAGAQDECMARPHPLAVLVGPLLTAGLILSSCAVGVTFGDDAIDGSGVLVTERLDVDEFQAISVSSMYDVDVVVGEVESLTITTDDNVMEFLDIEVRSDGLHLGLEDGIKIENATVRASVTLSTLERLDASGVSDVRVVGDSAAKLDVRVSGMSDIELDLTMGDVSIQSSGASGVSGAGEAIAVELGSSGTSSIDFSNVAIGSAEVTASGATEIDVSTAATVTGNISGAATLMVNPDSDVSVERSGGATVETGWLG